MESRWISQSWDIVAAAGLAVAAAGAASWMPAGSPLRVALTLPALFLVPGYLLLQGSLGKPTPVRSRVQEFALSVGISIPVVGALALISALTPSGFHAGTIVWSVTLGSLGLAGLAALRRAPIPQPMRAASAEPSPAED